jgi:hypothetical protein
MNRFIHETSLMAALLVLVAGLWQDWGTLVTLKRMLISYLCFFGLGAGMTLVVRAARFSKESSQAQGNRPDQGPKPVRTDV